ncbi:carboxypeptidase regulatory-like domain-containing protein [Mucilaginibacter corticis]|uniref:Carboxypeptidase regulatory-like domain-containing protein n=1 Tax=Mucilaginibacter corticis TaxID=2597670 RepID=A0A556MIP9_9SPHI|nr:carboxypeptidase regulatory-like domain-containing protein [Mucilaginibacter corticis]
MKTNPVFKAEGVKTTIAGTVTDLSHHFLPTAVVLLVSLNARINKTTITDANGRFRFDNLLFADSTKFAVQVRDSKNTDHAIITLDSIPQVAVNKKYNQEDVAITKANLKKAEDEGRPAKLTDHILKQVNIRSQRINIDQVSDEVAPQAMIKLPDEQSADQIITIPNPQDYPMLLMFMQSRLPGIRIEVDQNGYHHLVSVRPSDNLFHTTSKTDPSEGKEIEIVLDGRPIDRPEFDRLLTGSLLPEDVAKILIVRTNQAMVSNLGGSGGSGRNAAGIVLIVTKPAYKRKQYNPGIANISPKGYNKVRQFYSPRYDKLNSQDKQPDPRTTIYWSPYINTDATGKAKFDFYNANGPGRYRVVVEGIDANGQIGRVIYNYKVE